MVTAGVAEQVASKIASIVYLDAFVPADGQSIGGSRRKGRCEPFYTANPGLAFAVNGGCSSLGSSKMTSESTACFTEKINPTGAYQKIDRKAYIRAKNFAGFALTFERIRGDASWKTHIVHCGHDVMIDKPDELTSVLVGLI